MGLVLETALICDQDFHKVRLFLGAWVLCILPFLAGGQAISDSKTLFEAARREQKPVLLVFSGSDWCMPCIQLRRKVLSDTIFKAFCDRNLLLFESDFPQRKKLPPDKVKDNESLAARFNPKGLFPHVVLLSADEKVLKVLDTSRASVSGWLRILDQALPTR